MVDDDAALAEMLSLVLHTEGFVPIWCAHGDRVLNTYRHAHPDLVLLDLMLPGKDGMAICREIRSESPVPIVMLTAKTDRVTRHDTPVPLTPMEFNLLLAFARRPQHTFSRQMLLEQVWHFRHPVDTRLVTVSVQRLRAKIESDPQHPEIVVTVRGIGYRAGAPQTVA